MKQQLLVIPALKTKSKRLEHALLLKIKKKGLQLSWKKGPHYLPVDNIEQAQV